MTREGVVLITDADSDVGYRRAREFVDDGYRVVVTAVHVARLTRILLGQNADQVMAIAADLNDPIQRSDVLKRAATRLGPVKWIVDGHTGATSTPHCQALPRAS
jgi:NADP-dependent 3-hydroxy acid dehydrogenase YdfG